MNDNNKATRIFVLIFFSFVIILFTYNLRGFIFTKIEYKTAVGTVIKTRESPAAECSKYYVWYTYVVDKKTYKQKGSSSSFQIKEGEKFNVYYFPRIPSLHVAHFKEIVTCKKDTVLK